MAVSPHALKQLVTRKGKLQALADRLDAERKEAKTAWQTTEAAYADTVQKLQAIEVQINSVQQEPTVSEHAMLRYLERVQGVELKAVEAAILTPRVRNVIATLGDGKYKLDGHEIVVKNRTVVSLLQ